MRTIIKSILPILFLSLFVSNSIYAKTNSMASLCPPDSIENFTYLGSTNDDQITGVFRYSDYLVVCGSTYSSDSIPFPPTEGDSMTNNGTRNVFISLFSLDLDDLYLTQFIMGSADDQLTSAVITDEGKLVLMGITDSEDYPVTENAFQSTLNGTHDMFVSSYSLPLNTNSPQMFLPDSMLIDSSMIEFKLDFSTYFGGSGIDMGTSIDIDSLGNIYCLGNTNSETLPLGLVENSNTVNQGNGDVFLAKFNSTLDVLLTSAFIGGTQKEIAADIKIYNDSLLYILFNSNDLDISDLDTNQFSGISGGQGDAFVFVSDLDYSELEQAKVFGGNNLDIANSFLIKDNDLYITGLTHSTNLPTDTNSYLAQMSVVDTIQTFIFKTPIGLDSITNVTYLGGTRTDIGYDLVGKDSSVYLLGITNSFDFQTLGNPFSYNPFGGYDVFLAKFDSVLNLQSATYLGDIEDEWVKSVESISTNSIYELENYQDYSLHSSRTHNLTTDNTFLYLGANTWSDDFIIPFEHYDQLYNGALDIFLYKMKEDLLFGSGNCGGGSCGGGGPDDPVVISPPPVLEICENTDTFFVAHLNLEDVVYQWSTFDLDSLAWVTLVDDDVFTGSQNDTLFISNAPVGNTTVRCYMANTFHYRTTTPTTISILESQPVVSVLNTEPLFACIGDSIEVSVEGTVSYIWEDGTEGNSNWFSPIDTINTWVLGSNLICGFDTAFIEIMPHPLPAPITITSDEYIICQSYSVTISAEGAESYLWNDIGFLENIQIAVDSTSEIIISGLDENGCSSQDTLLIEVIPFQYPGFLTIDENEICSGDSTTLSILGVTNFEWIGEEETTLIVSPSQTTIYSAIATDDNNCTLEETIELIVFEPYSINISIETDSICLGDSTNFTAYGMQDYLWENLNSDAFQIVSPSETTIYTVVGTDLNGCTLTDSLTIAVLIFDDFGFLISSTDSICSGDSVVVAINDVYAYVWDYVSESIELTLEETTIISAIGIDINHCEGIETVEITVLPNPEIEYTTENETCIGNTDGAIILDIICETDFTIIWNEGFEGDSIPNLNEGVYHVWVVDEIGCTDYEEIEVINDNSDCFNMVFVPTIFSPNQDGNNDILLMQANGVVAFNLSIFDQWGNEVFQANDLTDSWDGNYNGQPVEEGVYYYLVSGESIDGQEFEIQSDVTLIR